MNIKGRIIRIGNHRPDNLDRMFKWSKMTDLIDLECGSSENIIGEKDRYQEEIMNSLIENNADTKNSFCHFGIYNIFDQVVGYADLQDIDYDNRKAELSISIPELQERNMGYGFEAFLLMLKYSFEELDLSNIIIRTRTSNNNVKKIAERLNFNFDKKIEIIRGKEYHLVEYVLSQNDYLQLKDMFH